MGAQWTWACLEAWFHWRWRLRHAHGLPGVVCRETKKYFHKNCARVGHADKQNLRSTGAMHMQVVTTPSGAWLL